MLIELPLGEPAFDARYMYYSTLHWRRLVNGYSGGQPVDYGLLDHALVNLHSRPDYAWAQIMEARPTHAIVHEAFYGGDGGARMSEFLRAHGARQLAVFGSHRFFELR